MENNIREKTETLKKWIDESESFVFFGGAGVSTESGIPDFRSADGLYNEPAANAVPPEKIISHTYFKMHPKEFFDFYRSKMIYRDAKPSVTHETLARLEKEGKCRAVITQNIDGLHQMAGSKNVLELHGSIYRNYCIKCGRPYDLDDIFPDEDDFSGKITSAYGASPDRDSCKEQEGKNKNPGEGMLKNEGAEATENVTDALSGKSVSFGSGKFEGVPVCSCGGVIKPDVVLYEESLDQSVLRESVSLIANTPMLIIGGTSLNVYPAAGLLQYFKGSHLVLINKESTPFDANADLLIQGALGEVFSKI